MLWPRPSKLPHRRHAASQNRVVGVVTAIDKATGQLTVKTDTGESITVVTNDKSAVLRLPPGETSAQNAAKITLGDVAVGDRLFARGTNAADGKSIDARQVVVTGAAVAAAAVTDQQRQREDFRQRGLMGRITALDSGKKEVTVQSRSREGVVPVTVAVTDSTKLFRYAPDSMNIKDATRASFSDLKVGDQLRALGEKNADGTRLSAEEIIAGSTTRTGRPGGSCNSGEKRSHDQERSGSEHYCRCGPAFVASPRDAGNGGDIRSQPTPAAG